MIALSGTVTTKEYLAEFGDKSPDIELLCLQCRRRLSQLRYTVNTASRIALRILGLMRCSFVGTWKAAVTSVVCLEERAPR